MLAKNIISKGLLMRSAGARSRAAYHGSGIKTTMNDLPVPEGDWQAHHSRRNAKYNAVLLAGIVALAGTIGLVKTTGIIHFNFNPPKSLD